MTAGMCPCNQSDTRECQPCRQEALDLFQTDPPTTVLLLTARSGAVGLTLTAASHVFLLEPNLNPAVESQAIGRAYRMGHLVGAGTTGT
jgi:SNF2 family DNA or RNA helicase